MAGAHTTYTTEQALASPRLASAARLILVFSLLIISGLSKVREGRKSERKKERKKGLKNRGMKPEQASNKTLSVLFGPESRARRVSLQAGVS